MKKLIMAVLIILSGDCLVCAEPAPVIAAETSLEQVTRQVINNHYASRILSAKTEEINGKKVHVIKMLTQDGHIQLQTFAADTGELLNIDNN